MPEDRATIMEQMKLMEYGADKQNKVDQDMRIMQALQNEPSTRALLGKYKQIGLDNGKPLFKHVDRQLFLQPSDTLNDKYKISDFVFAMDADSSHMPRISLPSYGGNTFATFYPKRSQNTLFTAYGEDIGDAGPPLSLCCALTLTSLRYFLTLAAVLSPSHRATFSPSHCATCSPSLRCAHCLLTFNAPVSRPLCCVLRVSL